MEDYPNHCTFTAICKILYFLQQIGFELFGNTFLTITDEFLLCKLAFAEIIIIKAAYQTVCVQSFRKKDIGRNFCQAVLFQYQSVKGAAGLLCVNFHKGIRTMCVFKGVGEKVPDLSVVFYACPEIIMKCHITLRQLFVQTVTLHLLNSI